MNYGQDGELSPEEDEDLKLAMQLEAEWNGATNNVAASALDSLATATSLSGGSGSVHQTTLMEDLDMQFAMKLQEEAYSEGYKPQPSFQPSGVPFNSFSFGAAPTPGWASAQLGGGSYRNRDKSEIKVPPTPEAVRRLVLDLKEVLTSKNPTIHAVPDENDITSVQALIIGVEGTPYAHGFFHFDMIFPHNYPWAPPKVQIMTTDSNQVRFNPNLYSCGKVCLSILGTWSGPSWTEIQTMNSTLLSIQSLMNDKPYHNEPGHETENHVGDIANYNACIEHETLRVAVCGMLEKPTCDNLFRDVMYDHFMENYEFYVNKAQSLVEKDGQQMRDPFGEERGRFRYASILKRLAAIKESIEKYRVEEAAKPKAMETQSDSEDEEESDEEEEEPEAVKMAISTTTTTTTTTAPIATVATTTTTTTTSTPTIEPPPAAAVVSPVPIATTHTPTPVPMPLLVPNPTPPATATPTPEAPADFSALLDKLCGLPSSQAGGVADQPLLGLPADAAAQLDFSKMFLDSDLSLAMELQKQMELDMEIAKSLQEEMYSSHGGGGGGGGSRDRAAHSYTPVKAPTLAELRKELKEEEKDYDPSIVCLVCKISPKTYIVLPSCEQPHILCMPCAEKSKNTPREDRDHHHYGRQFNRHRHSNKPSITCVLCKSVSVLDSTSGLKALKRHRKRKREVGATRCDLHNEDLSLFCNEEAELVCPTCCSTTHKGHNVDALNTARQNLTGILTENIQKIEGRWGPLEAYSSTLRSKLPGLEETILAKRAQVKDEIQRFRELLDAKEKELDDAVLRLGDRKRRHILTEIEKTSTQLAQIPEAISTVTTAVEEKDDRKFLEIYEREEEKIRGLACGTIPEAKREWGMMPDFMPRRHSGQLFHGLQYLDYPQFYSVPEGSAAIDFHVPEHSDDDDY
eukprot:TRINITY_DN921_c1_g1_i1.p1 TRINITY_DN921_c1_g1~~TRINITY_DN921_c1_g1_i1.p1  ORF type:complete len:913 (-),score=180.52 TRINITY_DN921_c1_g1_i1:35-2773(-)